MYEIYVDDSLIFRTGLDALQLASASIEKEAGKIDSFSFTIQPSHPFYGKLGRMKPVVTVWMDDDLIFRGRIIDIETDFYGADTVSCEGDMAYLMDSIIRPYDFTDDSIEIMTPRELISFFLNAHNEEVDSFKRFELGAVPNDADDTLKVSDSGYSSCWDALNSTLVDTLGGYLTVTHVVSPDGSITAYLNYQYELSAISSQTIEFGRNLADFTRRISGDEIVTAIIPLGDEIEEKDDEGNVTDRYTLTIESVNDGKDCIIDEEAAAVYGLIFKEVEFEHVSDPEYLLELGERYLEDAVKETATLDISAVDLALLDRSLSSFHVGEQVRVISAPHDVDGYYLVSKLTIDLLSASASKLTLGASYKTLTDQANEQDRTYGSLTLKMQKQLQDFATSMAIETRAVGTLSGGWEAAEGYDPPLYYRTADGMVYLSGTLTGGQLTGSSVAFTLAAGFRPSSRLSFKTERVIIIDTDGNVTIEGGLATTEVPLNSVFFRTE